MRNLSLPEIIDLMYTNKDYNQVLGLFEASCQHIDTYFKSILLGDIQFDESYLLRELFSRYEFIERLSNVANELKIPRLNVNEAFDSISKEYFSKPQIISVTGKPYSGKSTLLKKFEYPTYSSNDEFENINALESLVSENENGEHTRILYRKNTEQESSIIASPKLEHDFIDLNYHIFTGKDRYLENIYSRISNIKDHDYFAAKLDRALIESVKINGKIPKGFYELMSLTYDLNMLNSDYIIENK